jgi:hypothetical protein
MQATLWGRLENVRILLGYGTNKNLRDRNGFKAIHLAETSHQNEEDRYRKSGREYKV